MTDNVNKDEALTEEMLAAYELVSEPYPDLRTMDPSELNDGDVLMMAGYGWSKISEHICLPVSWLIRMLDGGSYSHATIVTIEDGEPLAWDHGGEALELHPGPLDAALKGHLWCHVYRMCKNGEHLGSDRYPAQPVVTALDAHQGDKYDIGLLVLAGIVTVISRMPTDPEIRALARRGLVLLVAALEWYIEHKDVRGGMLICCAVPGLAYWQALNELPHDYALQADLERHHVGDGDEEWQAQIDQIKDLLTKIWPDVPQQISDYQKLLAANAEWVDIGGTSLPVNFVSPMDLETSHTLERVGRLEIPKD
jgi:hypothetical protein